MPEAFEKGIPTVTMRTHKCGLAAPQGMFVAASRLCAERIEAPAAISYAD